MKKVLIADDSAFMRAAIKNILVKNGYSVIGNVNNGKDAVIKYMELLPDLVTLDITMDEMNGMLALKEIINYDKNANVVMVSAMGQKQNIIDAINIGAKGFLVKPFKEEKVIETLKQIFE